MDGNNQYQPFQKHTKSFYWKNLLTSVEKCCSAVGGHRSLGITFRKPKQQASWESIKDFNPVNRGQETNTNIRREKTEIPRINPKSTGPESPVSCSAIQAGMQWCNLCFLSSSNSRASVSQVAKITDSRVAGITGAHHHTLLIFEFLVEMGFYHIHQASLGLLTSRDYLPRPPKMWRDPLSPAAPLQFFSVLSLYFLDPVLQHSIRDTPRPCGANSSTILINLGHAVLLLHPHSAVDVLCLHYPLSV
ncbi:Zinc finger protein [Plecturocebus cupreus]